MSKNDKREIAQLRERLDDVSADGLLLSREEVAGLVCQLESKHAWVDLVGRRAQPAWDKMRAYLKASEVHDG